MTDTTDGAWERLDAAETVGIAATCAARLGKGDLVLLEAPLGQRGSRAGTWNVIRDFARRYKVSEDTVDQYRRMSGWYGPDRRSALKATGAVASYSLLRDVALHTFGSATEPDVRFAALVAALAEAAHDSRGRATRQDYLRRLGLDSEKTSARDPALGQVLQHIEQDPHTRAAVIEAVRNDPAVVSSVIRTVAEDPEGPGRFFDALVQEGGMEALDTAAFSLRRAKTDIKTREEQVFGRDEEPSDLELILRSVLRAMKALEKPLDLDPVQIVGALQPEQFSALTKLCGSVTHWHELLLAAARAAGTESEEVA